MNELLPTAQALLSWLIGIIGTLLTMLGAVALLYARNHIKANYVTKDELAAIREDDERRQEDRHKENKITLADIRTEVTGTNKRLDAFMQGQIRPYR